MCYVEEMAKFLEFFLGGGGQINWTVFLNDVFYDILNRYNIPINMKWKYL